MSKISGSGGGGESKNTLYCSFCGKSQHEVEADRRPDRVHLRRVRRAVHGHHPRGEQVLAGEVRRRGADPLEIYEVLNDYVIGQDHAKKVSRSPSTTTTSV